MELLFEYLRNLARLRFYGTVELEFRAGLVKFLRVKRTINAEELKEEVDGIESGGTGPADRG